MRRQEGGVITETTLKLVGATGVALHLASEGGGEPDEAVEPERQPSQASLLPQVLEKQLNQAPQAPCLERPVTDHAVAGC